MLNLLKPHFRSAVFYALYGPPVGGLLFILFITATSSTSTPNLLGTILLSIPVAYILGTVPALATGLILSLLPSLPLIKRFMTAALIGFFATSLFVFIVDYSGTALLALGIPAAFSAALLTLVQEFHFTRRSTASR